MSDTVDKIQKIREKISKKDEINAQEKGCPTAVLLYIATGRQSPYPVDPWYGQIKEKCNGANRHYSEIHKDFIFGMHEELEKACEFFTKKIDADKSIKYNEENLSKIEQETIKMFNLQDTYSLTPLTEEQSKRIESRTKKTINSLQNKDIEELKFPVLKKLGYAIKSTANDSKITSKAISNLDIVSKMLTDGEKETAEKKADMVDAIKKHPNISTLFNMAEQIFEMQKNNVLNKDTNIVDSRAFSNSSLVKDFTVYDNKFDLSKSSQGKKDNQAEI